MFYLYVRELVVSYRFFIHIYRTDSLKKDSALTGNNCALSIKEAPKRLSINELGRMSHIK